VSSAADTETETLSFRWAITNALAEELERDESVVLIGQDIARPGGTFGLTRGLHERFGDWRVRDAPISEEGLADLAIGAAIGGLRPVLEIMFMDFMALTMDALANQAAKTRYLSDGEIAVPMVVRTLAGGGFRGGSHHSQSLEAWFTHVPGLKVVFPSQPSDAKGLMKAAIRDEDPVIVLEHKSLLGLKGEVPGGDHVVPLGVGEVRREGGDVTVVATGRMVSFALEAASGVAEKGIDVEVIDPRTLLPLDIDLILDSVAKTGRVLVVHEAPKNGGFGAEVAAEIAEHSLYHLDVPVRRLAGAFTTIPVGVSEDFVFPSVSGIEAELEQMVA
jgi:pyruvate/2-oxoglutarate/acetoin dehydrogenase E1 component